MKDVLEVLIDDVLSGSLDETIVILGDFDVHVNDDTVSSDKILEEVSFQFDIGQIVLTNTQEGQYSGSLISNTSAILKYVDFVEETPSDHFFIAFLLESLVFSNKRKLKILDSMPDFHGNCSYGFCPDIKLKQ